MSPKRLVPIVAFLVFATLGAGRCYQVPIQQSRGGDAGVADEATDGDAVERCATGGPVSIVQARVVVAKGEAPGSWVDFEVRGPAHDARRVCRALVHRELAVSYPADTGLAGRLVRDCSDDALAEPETKSAVVLSDRRSVDAELALLPDECGAARGDGGARANVSASERRLTEFDDKASCEAMLAKLRTASEAAKAEVDDKAGAWIEREIAQLEQQAVASCKPDRKAEPCKRAEALLHALRDRKKAPPPAPSADSSRALVCRAR